MKRSIASFGTPPGPVRLDGACVLFVLVFVTVSTYFTDRFRR